MRIKYLRGRQCHKCHSRMILMLLRYGSTMSAISGVCHSCDYSMKWLIIRGNAIAPNTGKSSQRNHGGAKFRKWADIKLEAL